MRTLNQAKLSQKVSWRKGKGSVELKHDEENDEKTTQEKKILLLGCQNLHINHLILQVFLCKINSLTYFKAACAAARRAIGTRKGEQDT